MKTRVSSFSWLIATLLAVFTVQLQAQPQAEPQPEPPHLEHELQSTSPSLTPAGPTTTMEFEETTFDFGTVEEGEMVRRVYTFTNTGTEPLVLSNARGSCGCTVPKWPRAPIAPGESASITVEFNSKNKRGKRNQKVTLTANTNPPQTFIYLTGEVLSQEEAPSLIDFEPADEPAEDLEVLEITLPEIEMENVNPDCFTIFPNPTAETLQLKMDEEQLGQYAKIAIYNDGGQLMAQREIGEVIGTVEFDVSHYPAGTYIAQVQVGDAKPEARCFVVVE